jgi:hypothetical protein
MAQNLHTNEFRTETGLTQHPNLERQSSRAYLEYLGMMFIARFIYHDSQIRSFDVYPYNLNKTYKYIDL